MFFFFDIQKWPNHFISGIPFQKGQMATMFRPSFRAVVLNLFWLTAHFPSEKFFAAHQKLGKF